MNDKNQPKPVRIDLGEAKKLYDQGSVIPLDVVDTDSYEELSYQIKGAVRINPEDIEEKYSILSKEDTILAY
jgi:hypothetical protein